MVEDYREKYYRAVHELYPSPETEPTGGVRASQVAARVGVTTPAARHALKALVESGRLQTLGGLRGPTYAPANDTGDSH